MRRFAIFIFFLLTMVFRLAAAPENWSPHLQTIHSITNVAQIRNVSGANYVAGCELHLTGTITLVDTNRTLIVLQDATGAVALNLPADCFRLRVGQAVTINGTNCYPLFPSFPDFPLRSAGRDICTAFETPANWGEYNLTRMRGYLHPAATGDYKFWIASDNSSELWLSTDATQANARKIAAVPHFAWTEPRQWTKYPSQVSGPIRLTAGATYYIEALQEQTASGENLSVGWQGSGLSDITVIDGRFLTPWNDASAPAENFTNGILREYWTNFFVGDVDGMVGARPYESAITVEHASVVDHGGGKLPQPRLMSKNQTFDVDNNYLWVQKTGVATFAAEDGDTATLEMFDGQNSIEVHAQHWNQESTKRLRQLTNPVIQVEGVCEGVKNQLGTLTPVCIWASATNSIRFLESSSAKEFSVATNHTSPTTTDGNPALPGYYGTRGVVTFNARVLDEEYIFVQENNLALRIMLANPAMSGQFKVGQCVDVGGTFEPGKSPATLIPFFVSQLGVHSMPPIITDTTDAPSAEREGHWCEFEGVVHSTNPDGTLTLATRNGLIYLWLGQKPARPISSYVDAKLRARGVWLSGLNNRPLLLVPSSSFVNIIEEPPEQLFAIQPISIASLLEDRAESGVSHRVRVQGEVTLLGPDSFFLQDASGGIRVLTSETNSVGVGEKVDITAFPELIGMVKTLTTPQVRADHSIKSIYPRSLNLNDILAAKQNGLLVNAVATLLAQKSNGSLQVLELQSQQRIFVATLPASQGWLPKLLPGSQLQVIGVYDDENNLLPPSENKPVNTSFLSSPHILLRSSADVTVIHGPPWWTWKKTATLVGTLLTILMVALIWVHLLQRRLQRQQTAQLIFSQLVLGKLEEERHRIAVNLHDSLGQTLHVIKNHADLATQSPEEAKAVRRRLDEISSTAAHAIEDVRRITHGLRPYQLDRLGLTKSIRALIAQAAENRLISFASRIEEIDGLLDKDAEIHFYRIVQEAVTNVTKHSAATEATVVIKYREKLVSLSVRDNGKGFDYAKLVAQPNEVGFGLTGLGERARIIKGILTIDSKPQAGTSVTMEVPAKTC